MSRKLYIRFGDIPENERSGVYENFERKVGELEGVSVYECTQDTHQIILPKLNETTLNTFYGFFAHGKYHRRPVYLVSGIKVGVGLDNEPLIRDIKIVEQLTDFYGD